MDACTNACTDSAETLHGEPVEGDSYDSTECDTHAKARESSGPSTQVAQNTADVADVSHDSFAEAVAAIMRLPLSDGEKAEAVRRLLASDDASSGKPK